MFLFPELKILDLKKEDFRQWNMIIIVAANDLKVITRNEKGSGRGALLCKGTGLKQIILSSE
jgi:hypothetical protein